MHHGPSHVRTFFLICLRKWSDLSVYMLSFCLLIILFKIYTTTFKAIILIIIFNYFVNLHVHTKPGLIQFR